MVLLQIRTADGGVFALLSQKREPTKRKNIEGRYQYFQGKAYRPSLR